MAQIIKKVASTNKHKKYKVQIELFNSAMEVADTCKARELTSDRFQDKSKESFDSWEGVKSYDEALDLLRNGYQPTVDKMKNMLKANVLGNGKRFKFENNIVGCAPIVPLALKGVPNSMIDMKMRPIKCKVIDVYYDMTASAGTDSDDIIKAGQKVLGAILDLESQGYRFNLYAVQGYNDSKDSDMLVVKVKSATQPIDLKRISFPLTHTAFFRVIGFDWYSKVPGGKYRSGYGHALSYEFTDNEEMKLFTKQVFGDNAVYISCQKIIRKGENEVKEVLTNGNSKA